jgi:MauM/NapG family ferredoxin protein
VAWKRRDFLKSSLLLGGAVAVGAKFLRPADAAATCLRPPGALPEEDFLATCIRCGQCIDACPNRAITRFTVGNAKPFSMTPGRGDAGTPTIFARQQACNLCAGDQGEALLCTAACPTGALRVVPKTAEEIQRRVSMGRAALDTNLCYSHNGGSCGVCVRACPFEGKALKAGIFERPLLDARYCVGCGLCERACIRYPQAISIVPDARRAV